MAPAQPSRKSPDRGRIALAALFLYLIVAAMLLSLGGDDSEKADERADGSGADTASGGGITHLVATPAEWQAAVAVASPGDTIRLTTTIAGPLLYHGGDAGAPAVGSNGTAAAPITITADPGVWIDPGNYNSNGWSALDVRYVSHVHVVGVQVRKGLYGIRCIQCSGSPGAPIRIANNTTTDTGYVGIHVGGHLDTHAPSSHILIEGNTVGDTGNLVSHFGEGIYLGHGGQEWVDETNNVTVRNNEISHTSAEGIDIKPGTREIVVENNRLHHIAPIYGGAISAHYVNADNNPKMSELDRVVIRDNLIWNHNLNGVSGASDAAVWVGHGGVELVGNKFWGFRIHPNARSVRVQAKADFGPHPITIANNVFWTERGWVNEGSYAPTAIINASGNIGPAATGIEQAVTAADFVGPVPPIGQGGNADAGSGPGSGLVLASAATTSTTSPTTAPPPPTTAPPPPTTAPPPPSTTAPTTAPSPPTTAPTTPAPTSAPAVTPPSDPTTLPPVAETATTTPATPLTGDRATTAPPAEESSNVPAVTADRPDVPAEAAPAASPGSAGTGSPPAAQPPSGSGGEPAAAPKPTTAQPAAGPGGSTTTPAATASASPSSTATGGAAVPATEGSNVGLTFRDLSRFARREAERLAEQVDAPGQLGYVPSEQNSFDPGGIGAFDSSGVADSGDDGESGSGDRKTADIGAWPTPAEGPRADASNVALDVAKLLAQTVGAYVVVAGLLSLTFPDLQRRWLDRCEQIRRR